MLGDEMPWLVPLFFGSIAIWLFPKTVESFAKGRSERLLMALRWFPFTLLAVILSLRMSSILGHDTDHLEVVSYLQVDSSLTDRLHILFAGDGLVEWMLLPLVYLFAWNGQGMKGTWKNEHLHKFKRTLALMLLVSATMFFDDSAYIAPESLPLTQIPSPSVDMWMVITLLITEVVVISGLMSMYGPSKSLESYRRRLFLPASTFVLTAFAYLAMAFMDSSVFNAEWWTDPYQNDKLAMMWLWVFVGFNLHVFGRPIQEIESKLGAGDGRSRALAFSIVVSLGLLLIVTSWLMHQQDAPDATAIRSAFWLVGWISVMMAVVLLLPILGFDDGARPELDWARWTLLFGPMVLFVAHPYSPFLLLGSWFALIATMVLPWMLEREAKSLPVWQVIGLGTAMIAVFSVTLLSGQGLVIAIPLGGIFATASSMMMLRHAVA
ncbi:MAG: hypothetical protein HOL79_02585 [Euryarchaeota archaeon]|nr:hypothetical protein [Euryarchaeota archaeon]